MMTKAKLIGLSIIAISASLAAAGWWGTAAKPGNVTLRMAGNLPITHHLSKASDVFKNAVERKSNGKIKIDLFPAGQLYNDKDLVTVLPKGGVDIADLQPDFWTGLVPSSAVFQWMTYFSDYDHYWRVIEGEPGKIIDKEFEEKANCKVLTWLDYGHIEMISKIPIKTVGDIRQQRIRSFGEGTSLWLQALQASPVSMSASEVFQALQRHTVDGAISGPTSFYERKWYESCKYSTELPLTHTAHVLAINIDTWNKLTPDQQKILMDAAQEAREFNKEVWAEEEKLAKEALVQQGMKFNPIPESIAVKWRQKSTPVYHSNLKERIGAEKAKKLVNLMEAVRKK